MKRVTEPTKAEERRILKLAEAALEPFANACYNDNGDITVNTSLATYNDYCRAYFALRALKASHHG